MAPKTHPEAGGRYRLRDTFGSDPGVVYAGQEVVVREFVAAGTPGAHNAEEDAVVVEWQEDGPVMGDDGRVSRGKVGRAVAVAADEFDDMFEGA